MGLILCTLLHKLPGMYGRFVWYQSVWFLSRFEKQVCILGAMPRNEYQFEPFNGLNMV